MFTQCLFVLVRDWCDAIPEEDDDEVMENLQNVGTSLRREFMIPQKHGPFMHIKIQCRYTGSHGK